MTLEWWESAVRIAGIALLAVAWVGSGVGAASGAYRKAGRSARLARRYRAHLVYFIGAAPYFAVCGLLWRPLPGTPPGALRVVLLVGGAAVGFAGGALYLAGRRALGAMYNVSSSIGTELYADHRLVTTGPFAHVRHPMYVGLVLAALGGLAVYRTWTLVFMCVALGGAFIKAHLEERLLAEEFGPAWEAYAAAVPGWVPRLKTRSTKEARRGQRTTPA